jgi:biopolymer transport protein ExbB
MIVEWFLKGGPMMWALLACSLWGCYIIIYKLFYLRANAFPHSLVLDRLKSQLQHSGKEKVLQEISGSPQLVWRVLRQAIKFSDMSDREVQHQVEAVAQVELSILERNMNILSAIITIAPILGLLGTVLGLMDIFGVISGGDIGDATALSAGIAQALITTVAGMAISVPFILFYQYLNYRIEALFSELTQVGNEVIGYCKGQGGR